MPRVVILGCGRQGARLAQLMEAEKWDVSVIDFNHSSFKRLEQFKGQKIFGNGIDIDVLKKGGIEKAYAFAAVTNGDNTNLMTAQMAKDIFKVPKVVCRVYDPRRSSIYHDLGLQTVCATTVGARMLRNVIISPAILRSYQMGNGTALAIEIKVGSIADGKKLEDIEIPGEFRVSAVIRDTVPIIPTEGFIVKNNDHLFGTIMIGEDGVASSSLDKIKQILQIDEFAVNYPLKGGY